MTANQSAAPAGTYALVAYDDGTATDDLLPAAPGGYFKFNGANVEFGLNKNGWKPNGEVKVNDDTVTAKIDFTGYEDLSEQNATFKVTRINDSKVLLETKLADGKKRAVLLRKLSDAEAQKAEQDVKP